jgi:hypothetical protein
MTEFEKGYEQGVKALAKKLNECRENVNGLSFFVVRPEILKATVEETLNETKAH